MSFYSPGNTYFGEPWDSGICTMGRRRPTPVGEPCAMCSTLFEEDDRGVFIWSSLKEDNKPRQRPMHRECAVRASVGGIGHLVDHTFWCENMQDPDAGLGYRESALRVWARLCTGAS